MSKRSGRKSQASNDFLEPFKPVIGTATNVGTDRAYNNGAASVTFTDAQDSPPATSYTVTSSPGSFTGTGSSSPIIVEGLQSATSYTFTVVASNSVGSSVASDASNSITATTVPQTPSAPSLSNNGAETNAVSWSAPQTGGSEITGYGLIDHENDVTSYGASTFSANLSENGNEAQTVRVRAQNANGFSSYSSNSNSVTTTPFSFAPFGFTPFGFTPFGFTPFGFTPFGFTPFGFTPVKSIGAETLIKSKNPEGLLLAYNLNVGDTLYSASIEGINVSNETIMNYIDNWSAADPSIDTEIETTVVALAARITDNGAVVLNGNKYSRAHWVLVKENGLARFKNVAEITAEDFIFSPATNNWEPVTEITLLDSNELVISIDVEPYDVFFTDNALVHDSYSATADPNALHSSDDNFADKLDALYDQWKALQNNPPAE
jgi:hypothetical protein